MNKISKNLLVLFLALLLGGYFGVYSVQAQDDKLILETSKECDIQYTGNNCVAELKLTNNVGEILDGTASLHIDYQGACSNNKLENFDGVGITAQFSINNVDWLNFSGWENGITTVSGFNINKDGTQPKLKIETVPNLCPGKYTFALSVKGTFEEEEYIAPTVAVGGGGGGYLPSGLTILEASATSTDITTTSVTIIWTTSYFSTSQVIYALGSESHLLDLTDSTGTPPKYGYARTTPEQDTSLKVTSHSVKIDVLAPGTTYYYRTVSHGSLAISTEHSFTTLGTGIEEKIEEEKSTEEGAVLGEKIFSTKEPTEKRIVLGERVSLAEKSIGKKAVLGEKVPPAEKSTEEGAVLDKEAPVAQEPTTAPQPITSRSLLASIGNIITLGTGSVIVGLLVVIAILALAGYAVYFLIQKTRRKN